MDKKHPHPNWLPRHGQHTRWDRAIAIGDSVFRWHSRLDGTALLFGPAGKLAIGDTVPRPVGHLHHPEAVVPPVIYVVTRIHDDGGGHVWIEAVRRSAP